jgi:hypothetical protein
MEDKGEDNDDYAEIARKTERRSARICKSPQWFANPVLTVMLVEHDEPTTYMEAMEGSESERWLEPMRSEIRSMYDNQSMDLGRYS